MSVKGATVISDSKGPVMQKAFPVRTSWWSTIKLIGSIPSLLNLNEVILLILKSITFLLNENIVVLAKFLWNIILKFLAVIKQL